MKNYKRITLILVFVAFGILSLPVFAQHVPDGFLSNDLEGAKKLASQQNKPIYIHFTTDWCGWCRKIESETYPSPIVKDVLKKFVAVSLDLTDTSSPKVKKWSKLMSEVGGEGYPTLAMITADGAFLNMVGGFVDPHRLKKELNKALKNFDKIKEFAEYAKTADTGTLEFNLKAMGIYSDLGQTKKAAAAAEKVIELDKDNKSGRLADAHIAIVRRLTAAAPASSSDIKKARENLVRIRRLLGTDAKNKPKLAGALLSVAEAQLMSLAPDTPVAKIKSSVDIIVTDIDDLEKLTASDKDAKQQLQILTANTAIVLSHSGDKARGTKLLQRALDQIPDGPVAAQIKKYAESVGIELK